MGKEKLESKLPTMGILSSIIVAELQGSHDLIDLVACKFWFQSNHHLIAIVISLTTRLVRMETGKPNYVPKDAAELAASSAKNDGTLIMPVLVGSFKT